MNSEAWKLELSDKLKYAPVKMEIRHTRDGAARHTERRYGKISDSGLVYWDDWLIVGTIPNYGDCFDPKPKGIFDRLMDWIVSL